MPMVQPKDLWIESARWDKFGPELLSLMIMSASSVWAQLTKVLLI